MAAFRTVLFLLLLSLLTIPFGVLVSLAVFFPMSARYRIIAIWRKGFMALCHYVLGIRYRVLGRENMPAAPAVVMAKHQSAWETFTMAALLSDPTFVLKRELQWIPLFGWYTMKAKLIPVNRGARKAALDQVTELGHERMKANRQLIIYAEGTRRPVDAPPNYKYGVAYLYEQLNVPCVPVALNSSLY